jgi:hypothetical protein
MKLHIAMRLMASIQGLNATVMHELLGDSGQGVAGYRHSGGMGIFRADMAQPGGDVVGHWTLAPRCTRVRVVVNWQER